MKQDTKRLWESIQDVRPFFLYKYNFRLPQGRRTLSLHRFRFQDGCPKTSKRISPDVFFSWRVFPFPWKRVGIWKLRDIEKLCSAKPYRKTRGFRIYFYFSRANFSACRDRDLFSEILMCAILNFNEFDRNKLFCFDNARKEVLILRTSYKVSRRSFLLFVSRVAYAILESRNF